VKELGARTDPTIECAPTRPRAALVRARSQRFLYWLLLAISVAGLAPCGCKVGPDYHRPAALGTNAMPAQFSALSSTNHEIWKPAEPAAHLPRDAWWELFQDPVLNRLENVAAGSNQQLAAASARFQQARASFNLARSGLFPKALLAPNVVRQRTSANEPSDGHASGISPTYNTFTLQSEVAWELDLWGRVRREVEGAQAQLDATAADLQSVKLAIEAEVAVDYFTLRALDAERELLSRTADAFRRSLELTLNRRKAGVASDLDVSQAQTQLRTTEALLPSLRLQRVKILHAIATLCGQAATGFDIAEVTEPLPAPTPVPVGLPSELLERRPDIASAERLVASANAQVGVAVGAFYPRIQLHGLAGLQSLDASSWFDWPSRFWAVGPSMELPLFTGGRNRAQLALARAAYDETVANYRQTVLTAFQEVEDQIAAQQLLEEQLRAEAAALEAAQRNLEIANNRYKAGLVTYLEVAVAQGTELNIERTVVQLRGDKLVAAVALIKSIGGGWEVPRQLSAIPR
jgi:outer membrane protein, multidrug efflux system